MKQEFFETIIKVIKVFIICAFLYKMSKFFRAESDKELNISIIKINK